MQEKKIKCTVTVLKYSQPCAENDEKVTLFEVIADTLKESLRQVFSKEDNVGLDHSSTFGNSASGNLSKNGLGRWRNKT